MYPEGWIGVFLLLMKGHFVYHWVLKEMAFFAITLDSWEHFKATPARTRAFLGVFDNSRGVRDHGNFRCAAIRIMGKLQKRKGTWEGLTWKVKLFAPPLTPCAATATKNRPRSGWLRRRCDLWILGLLVSLFTSILCIRCGYLHSFRCEWKKINIPTICWPSSELNNKCSLVTNLPEGATQILLQTICNHQILRTIFYFQSAQKWKWILQDHWREMIASFHRAVPPDVGLHFYTIFVVPSAQLSV